MRKLAVMMTTTLGVAGCGGATTPPKKAEPAPEEARQQAVEETHVVGLLGSANAEGALGASLTGIGDLGGGLDDANVYGGLIGTDDGAGGLGLGGVRTEADASPTKPAGAGGVSGTGTGGGGVGWGTIGTGKIGTGIGYGPGGRRRAPGPTTSVGAAADVKGDLDTAIIRRYIKRNLAKISYCYEKELAAQPTLAGSVKIEFTIGPDGKVKKSTGSGMSSVQTCVAAVISGIEFPRPQGGGSVVVSYPFTFRPS
ncbi:MAG: AgmX/PglI C-terminal domain-containing protein [Deltaproteobacteria bacterium]|nr:AgmX/PglI C-terminal domain-containing protein [Deltaproteobacteria bacterium]